MNINQLTNDQSPVMRHQQAQHVLSSPQHPQPHQQQLRCYLCEIPKQEYSLTRHFSEIICRGCLNYEGPDKVELLIAEARRSKCPSARLAGSVGGGGGGSPADEHVTTPTNAQPPNTTTSNHDTQQQQQQQQQPNNHQPLTQTNHQTEHQLLNKAAVAGLQLPAQLRNFMYLRDDKARPERPPSIIDVESLPREFGSQHPEARNQLLKRSLTRSTSPTIVLDGPSSNLQQQQQQQQQVKGPMRPTNLNLDRSQQRNLGQQQQQQQKHAGEGTQKMGLKTGTLAGKSRELELELSGRPTMMAHNHKDCCQIGDCGAEIAATELRAERTLSGSFAPHSLRASPAGSLGGGGGGFSGPPPQLKDSDKSHPQAQQQQQPPQQPPPQLQPHQPTTTTTNVGTSTRLGTQQRQQQQHPPPPPLSHSLAAAEYMASAGHHHHAAHPQMLPFPLMRTTTGPACDQFGQLAMHQHQHSHPHPHHHHQQATLEQMARLQSSPYYKQVLAAAAAAEQQATCLHGAADPSAGPMYTTSGPSGFYLRPPPIGLGGRGPLQSSSSSDGRLMGTANAGTNSSESKQQQLQQQQEQQQHAAAAAAASGLYGHQYIPMTMTPYMTPNGPVLCPSQPYGPAAYATHTHLAAAPGPPPPPPLSQGGAAANLGMRSSSGNTAAGMLRSGPVGSLLSGPFGVPASALSDRRLRGELQQQDHEQEANLRTLLTTQQQQHQQQPHQQQPHQDYSPSLNMLKTAGEPPAQQRRVRSLTPTREQPNGAGGGGGKSADVAPTSADIQNSAADRSRSAQKAGGASCPLDVSDEDTNSGQMLQILDTSSATNETGDTQNSDDHSLRHVAKSLKDQVAAAAASQAKELRQLQEEEDQQSSFAGAKKQTRGLGGRKRSVSPRPAPQQPASSKRLALGFSPTKNLMTFSSSSSSSAATASVAADSVRGARSPRVSSPPEGLGGKSRQPALGLGAGKQPHMTRRSQGLSMSSGCEIDGPASRCASPTNGLDGLGADKVDSSQATAMDDDKSPVANSDYVSCGGGGGGQMYSPAPGGKESHNQAHKYSQLQNGGSSYHEGPNAASLASSSSSSVHNHSARKAKSSSSSSANACSPAAAGPPQASSRKQQQQQQATPTTHYNPLKCMACKERLEDRHFVQCPSVVAHKFCFGCSKISIERQQADNKNLKGGHERVFCPSGNRCHLANEQTPWTFMNSEIETIIRESSRQSSSSSVVGKQQQQQQQQPSQMSNGSLGSADYSSNGTKQRQQNGHSQKATRQDDLAKIS